MVWPHAIEKSINQLNSYDFLTEEDKKKIFYDNAVKFLKLNEYRITTRAISNCLFSPTIENPRGFSIWCVIAKFRANPRNYS
jgi:hypothetical protein